MTRNYVSALLLVSFLVTTAVCQTFQYSRGWTNGKRSETSALEAIPPELKVTNLPIQASLGQLDCTKINCELQKMRILMQISANEQLYHLPCELFNAPRRNPQRSIASGQFHRGPGSVSGSNY